MEISDAIRVKVGRLKPGEGDLIHLFVDGVGELIMITRQEAEGLVAEAEGMVIVTLVDGVEYWVFVWQLRNMLNKWPRKKAAVFRRDNVGSIPTSRINCKILCSRRWNRFLLSTLISVIIFMSVVLFLSLPNLISIPLSFVSVSLVVEDEERDYILTTYPDLKKNEWVVLRIK